MALQVAECDAASRSFQHGLVAYVPVQVQRGGQLGLAEHHDIWSLLSDQPVKVLLLLGRVNATHIPHEDCQWDCLDVQVPS